MAAYVMLHCFSDTCIIIIAALHTAGKHMENSIVAAYVALLFQNLTLVLLLLQHYVQLGNNMENSIVAAYVALLFSDTCMYYACSITYSWENTWSYSMWQHM